MTMISLTQAPARTRGLLSRYCLEVRAGLFVGRLDKRMRQTLWAAIAEQATPKTSAVLAWSRPTAQGYAFKSFGPTSRRPVIVDGLWLVAEAPAGQTVPADAPFAEPDMRDA